MAHYDPTDGAPTIDTEGEPIPTLPVLQRHPARCVDCGKTFLTGVGRERCATCFLTSAADCAYWADEAERMARTEAQRILDSPEIAAARLNIRERMKAWGIEAQTSGVPF